MGSWMPNLNTVPCWILGLLCMVSRVSLTSHTRIHCAPDFPCSCQTVKFYPEYKAVVENVVDCSFRQLSTVPDLHQFVGYQLSTLDLHNNNLTSWTLKHDGPVFENVILGNYDPYSSTQSGPPHMDLSDNPLGSLYGEEFSGIIALELVSLRLQNCALDRIPALGAYLAAWTGMLDLKFNYISVVTAGDLSAFSNLRSIDLGGNSDLHVVDNAFHNQIASLENIALEGTGLDHFPADLLAPLQRLSHVFLGQNNISQLSDYVMDNFQCDRLNIHLNQNALRELSDEVFRRECLEWTHGSTPPPCTTRGSCILSELYLDYNNIQVVGFIGDLCSLHMDNLTSISLMGNPVQCDCHLYGLLFPRVIYVEGRCHEPLGMRGVSLWHQQTSGFLSFPTLMADTCDTENLTVTPTFSYSDCLYPVALTGNTSPSQRFLLSHLMTIYIILLIAAP